MPEKKHVCPIDGRRFATKAALDQHRRSSHGTGPPAQMVSGEVKRVPSRKKAKPGLGRSAPVSLAASVRGNASDMARMSGTDRIFSQDVSTNGTKARSKLAEVIIVPGVFKRLAMAAKAYQRIRYVNLRFRVETQLSTVTSGGYVVAFVRDPADEVLDIDSLTAQRGSCTTKWWQSAMVDVGGISQRLLYTSESKEVREYSPGKLVIFSDGAPTQNGNFTVFCEWQVELSSASLENPADVAVVYTAKSSWYAHSGHQGFWASSDGKNFTSNAVDLITPAPAIGSYWRLPFPAVVTQSNGNVRSAHWAYVLDADSVLPCYTSPKDSDTGQLKIDDLLIPAGTPLDLYTAPQVQGEAEAPSSSDSPTMTAGYEELSLLLRTLLSSLTSTSRESTTSSGRLRRDSASSSLECLPYPEASDSTEKS